jgi:hypothetical protein
MYSYCKPLDFLAKETTLPNRKMVYDGIPEQILQDGYNHRQAFPGDHGLRFEAIPEFASFFGVVAQEEHAMTQTS